MMKNTSGIIIENPIAQRVLEWTGRRSYAIYLLQYTTINVMATVIYSTLLGTEPSSLPGLMRIGCWAVLVVFAWLLALLIASIVDTTLVKAAQKLFDWAARSLAGAFSSSRKAS